MTEEMWQQLFSELTAQAALAEEIMNEISKVARQRATELHQHTGRAIVVEDPGEIELDPDGHRLRVLRLRSGRRDLYIYFHRSLDGTCAIHFVRGGPGGKRMTSQLACVVTGKRLRDSDGEITVDVLLLRCFRMLLSDH